jgi:hypothetical protein
MRLWPRAVLVLCVTMLAACSDTTAAPAVNVEEALNPKKGLPVGYAASFAASQNELANCMRREGFEWLPIGVESAVTSFGDDLDDLDFARQFGFGLAAAPPPSPPPISDAERANAAYQSSLDEQTLVAFAQVLTKCEDASLAILSGNGEVLGTALEQLRKGIRADPQVDELWEGWSACMDERGLRGFADEQDAVEDVLAEYQRILTLPEVEQADLIEALATEERALAVATEECFAPLADRYAELREPYDRAFMADNPELFAEED